MIGRLIDNWGPLRSKLMVLFWRGSLRAVGASCRINRGVQFIGTRDIALARGVTLDRDARLVTTGQGMIEIGADTYIGPGSNLISSRRLIVEADVLFGPRVYISTHRHSFEKAGPVSKQGLTDFGDVVIERGAWLGANSVIAPGVRIGAGAVVAANAVVTSDVAPRAVVGGVPAKPLRHG